MGVGVDDIGVRGDRIEGFRGSIGADDTRGATGVGRDRADLVRKQKPSAKIQEKPRQSVDESMGAAPGEPHAAVPLQSVDQGVDRGRGEGAAADQQRMERERLAEVVVAYIPGDLAVDAAPGLEPDQLGRRGQHVGELEERYVAEPLVPLGVDGFRELQESTVTCYINPADPDDATLNRDPSLGWLFGLLPLVLLASGLALWPR